MTALRHDKGRQDTIYEKRYCGVDFTDVRLDKIAEAMGCFGKRVSDPAGIKRRSMKPSTRPAACWTCAGLRGEHGAPTLSTINDIWFMGCEGCNL